MSSAGWMVNEAEGYRMRQVWWVEDLASGRVSRDYFTAGAATRASLKRSWVDPVIRADVIQEDIPVRMGEV